MHKCRNDGQAVRSFTSQLKSLFRVLFRMSRRIVDDKLIAISEGYRTYEEIYLTMLSLLADEQCNYEYGSLAPLFVTVSLSGLKWNRAMRSIQAQLCADRF